MKVFGDWLVAPVALLSLATGLVLALGTPWGLARHRWVWVKFWLTLVTGAATIFALRPGISAAAALGIPDSSLVAAPIVASSAYFFMTAISVLKPWGLTAAAGVCEQPPALHVKRWTEDRYVSQPDPMPTSLADLPVRRLTLADLTACADLSEDRGWPREEHRWGLLLAAGNGYGIDAPEGKGLAASSVLTSYGPAAAHEPGLAAIGMVLVAGRHARQGVGRRLMRHLIAEAGDTPLTLHATPHGRPLYEQLGFAVTGRAEMVRGHFRPSGIPADVPTRRATADDLPAILHLDTEVFGQDRTHILARLPAFADQIRIAEDHNGITGYAAAWPNMQTHVVGPLIARDTQTAKALITSLAAGTDRPLRTDIDVRHENLLDWLKTHGLEPVAFNDVMTYGIPAVPGDWTRRFAPLTLAAG